MVIVYNRVDGCCARFLNGAKVWVGDGNPEHWKSCGTLFYRDRKFVYSVSCEGATGTYVRITQDNNYLQLAEVQVIGKEQFEISPFSNMYS